MSKKTKANSETEVPNIQYVGRRQKLDKTKLKMVEAAKQAPEFIMDGKTKIKLPRGIEHGVYMPVDVAQRLLALRPKDFKTPVLKSKTSKTKVSAKQGVKSPNESTDTTGDK